MGVHYDELFTAFIISFLTVLVATPIVRRFALTFGFIDKPEKRKIHKTPVATIGGVAIMVGAIAGFLYLPPTIFLNRGIVVGMMIIASLGVLDDKYTFSPQVKWSGQILAAICVVFSGVTIQFLYLPFLGKIELGMFSTLVTVLWIVGITNAINFIDGLDGLAAGVTSIALLTILTMAIIHQLYAILPFVIILIGSTLGFLPYNFHPASIFMGDTGAMFLGFSIATLSVFGFLKSVTLFSFVIPIMILGVPILDTFFAIVRRLLNKQRISTPDRLHLHHRLIAIGFTHRATVLIIYIVSLLFGIAAIVLSTTSLQSAFLILIGIAIFIQLTAETIGLTGDRRKPLLYTIRKIKKKPQNSG